MNIDLRIHCVLLMVILVSGCNEPKTSDNKTSTVGEVPKVDTTGKVAFQPSTIERPPADVPKRYSVKSGIIELSYKGAQNGKETIYFDDWGMKEVKFTHILVKNPMRSDLEDVQMITLMRDTMIFIIDEKTKNAREIINDKLYDLALEHPDMDLAAVAENTMKEQGGKIIGQETIAGKVCNVWDIEKIGNKNWIWEGITLKTYRKTNGTELSITAESIQVNVPIPTEKFEIPEGTNVQPGMRMNDYMKRYEKKRKVNDLRSEEEKEAARKRQKKK